MSKKRSWIDRITNRDIVREQAAAIAEFERNVGEFTKQLDRLHSRVLVLIPPEKPGEEPKIEPT